MGAGAAATLRREVKGTGWVRCGRTSFAVTDYMTNRRSARLGYFYGAGPSDIFRTRFCSYSNLLSILTESLHNVAVAGLSKLRDNVDELKRSWASALSLVSFVHFRIICGAGRHRTGFRVLLLGEKWGARGPLLCIFAR
jgi:PST family polysaccharide transporter